MHGSRFQTFKSYGSNAVQVQEGGRTSLMTCLLEGPSGSGKTALAASVAISSNLPFVKVISSANMMGFSESAKGGHITKIIEDAYRVWLDAMVQTFHESRFHTCMLIEAISKYSSPALKSAHPACILKSQKFGASIQAASQLCSSCHASQLSSQECTPARSV